ncbi:hypothetical protein LTR78_006538 [Recurvomyces mirabilis]|uniref:Methyltransferase domain-containing protein n=1 Tax=Recurvomyces mirabilis TaxID=574656 RepID=A0AAE0WKZ7_9PEZI|nr:hypothetical protein LTR78_006538 [Recurvomyces mirabilis]KAK5151044.1 hypothetical protein LTS14_009539 [Recurvomyces mirabilis]
MAQSQLIPPPSNAEAARLNEQHKQLIEAFGFHVHPTISLPHKEGCRVADVACGSGVFLTEIAAEHPSWQCDGFDITDKQFPSGESLAHFGGRVRFHVQDGAAELGYGSEYDGKFDLVTVRAMHAFVIGVHWPRVVKNAVALLKPGGYVQIEWDAQSPRVVQSKPGVSGTAMRLLNQGFNDFILTRGVKDIIPLRDLLSQNGITDLRSELWAMDETPGYRQNFTMTMIVDAPNAIMARVLQGDKYWSREKVEQLKAQAAEEMKQDGIWFRTEMWCYVGKKSED